MALKKNRERKEEERKDHVHMVMCFFDFSYTDDPAQIVW